MTASGGVAAPPMAGARRLVSIDALRGWAALAVVLFHFQFGILAFNAAPIPGLVRGAWPLLSFGYAGVWLFFVISGFCIHLRWAQARAIGNVPRVTFIDFWRRRIRRLSPPYLVALAVYLVVTVVTHSREMNGHLLWSLGLHLVMLQNIDVSTLNTFNSVFWTLAIEEQLYLAYFLLLWLRVRHGWVVTLTCCLGARIAWFGLAVVLKRTMDLEIPVTHAAAAQWFIWALGALAVEAAFNLVRLPRWCSSGLVATALLVATGALVTVDRGVDPRGWFHSAVWLVVEPAWGFAFFVAVNHFVGRERGWRTAGHVPVFLRYSAQVGLFSYSLYLTHQLILSHVWPRLVRPSSALAYGVTVFLPLTLAFAWVFFRAFERPFLNRSAMVMVPGTQPAIVARAYAESTAELPNR